MKDTFGEFARYIMVGGTAFLVDAGIVFVSREFLFMDLSYGLYFAVALGFATGLLVNYWLSIIYVFKKGKDKTRGRRLIVLIIFVVIGLLGFGLTELGMYFGSTYTSLHYMLVKVVVSGIVMLWNFTARKIIVFGDSRIS